MTWTPEALEELLAPIALYPDSMLAQVLIASTNPQEVLDAGNWLLQNQGLKGKALDEAALKVGFTPPIRALLQFPETVDMMCMQLDWTTELGQAFTADQQGVLDAVQRLRRQAQDVGNLKSSPQLKVETQEQNGQEVVTVSSPNPEVVYVPQYDPVAVYAPAPAAAATVPATTTTTTTTTESAGHSTGTLVMTGLLAFGAGMLVNEVFDDDEDDYWKHHNYYYPNYGYGGMPYYPPYPYRPVYGNGYYPANGYNRPPNYQHGFNNNNIVVINNGQNNYWNDRSKRATTYQRNGGTYQARSPISSARPNRPELQQLNQRQPRPMPADVKRPSNTATASNWKGQSTYAGAKGGGAKTAAAGRPAATTQQARPAPKVQGSYAGATPDRAKPAQGGYAGAQPDRAKPAQGGYAGAQASRPQASSREDRGYGQSQAAPRPQQAAKPAQQPRPQAQPSRSQGGGGGGRQNAMAGSDRGAADRQASQRGKQSMPQGARSKGGGGGGGGGGGKKGKR
ncbi:MAG TPA: DUF3300 domain-containing protein [Burkholderiaceae bacterium]|nr:DUF3300 domain-containing protein [Burkholderiaceae bacterium]